MDKVIIAAACDRIYKRFPEMKGTHPKVLPQTQNQYLLIFHGTAEAPDGKTHNRTVRVLVNKNGKLSKVTTSR